MTLERDSRTPEERTAELFSLNADALSERLKPLGKSGMVISLPDSKRRIRISLVQAFPQVGDYYKAIERLKPGDLWNAPKRQIAQSLVIAPFEGEKGSCVRLLEAEFYDSHKGEFVSECTIDGEKFVPREGAIAKYLQLDKGDVSQLKFVDQTDTLFIVKTQPNTVSV